jgi:hypothetical protein
MYHLWDPLEVLPDLKGAPLACLYALQFCYIPVTVAFLARISGYSEREIRSGLGTLWIYGFAVETKQGTWKLDGEPGFHDGLIPMRFPIKNKN